LADGHGAAAGIRQTTCIPGVRSRRIVVAETDGELAIRIIGFGRHTSDMLFASLSGRPERETHRRFVDYLLGDRSVIALWGMPGEVRVVWVCLDPARDANYTLNGETILLRNWSVRP
jgi:hypothetical protein